ncbi:MULTISPECIES: nuclear transport factor 2 family protein [Pseudomonas]|uniref:nuclear transport factor 2 family protein n=1 Tax=Pseudomonas TaxID=286 RepID=UPI00224B967E|nr:nuclear transport factor 2 family protein [Pseudomonas sp. DCB_BI]MCX2890078.1 nuclear transport factor 2 family protein [Pseudomonas sp. DCB_BI]
MSSQPRSIEQRLEQLEDREKIKELKYRYAFHLDNGYDPDSIAALFSEDGEWIIKGVGGDVRGQGAIRAHCKNLSKGILWSQHDIFAPRIEISDQGDRAVAHFNLVCLLTMRTDGADAKGEAFLLAGNYTDHLVKINGAWLFQSMTGTIEQSSPWAKGWVEAPFKKESW